jgi:hypothetical protein
MTTARFKTLAVLALAFGAAALGTGCNVEHGAINLPTYEADVRPILMARCVRCHGEPPLGDPETSADDGTPPGAAPITTPRRFDVYGDTDCGTDAGVCIHGAASSAGLMVLYINFPRDKSGMPPLPAPALTSYQHDTIVNWAAEMPPLER